MLLSVSLLTYICYYTRIFRETQEFWNAFFEISKRPGKNQAVFPSSASRFSYKYNVEKIARLFDF